MAGGQLAFVEALIARATIDTPAYLVPFVVEVRSDDLVYEVR
jgi:hypothetical protein